MKAIILKGAALRQPPLPQSGPPAKTIAHPCSKRIKKFREGMSLSSSQLKFAGRGIRCFMLAVTKRPCNMKIQRDKILTLQSSALQMEAARFSKHHRISDYSRFKAH
jgi:hypothetical protein